MSVWASSVTFHDDAAPFVYECYGKLTDRVGFFDFAVIPGQHESARLSLNDETVLLDPEQIRALRKGLENFLEKRFYQPPEEDA